MTKKQPQYRVGIEKVELGIKTVQENIAHNSSERIISRHRSKKQRNQNMKGHLSGFHLSVESKLRLLCFCITTLSDWLKNLAPLSQPIRIKTKTNRDSLAHVFPRFVPATCICFEF